MSYHLGVLNAGPDKYAVGVYDNTTAMAADGNAAGVVGFPDAVRCLCDYARRFPDFTKIHHTSLNPRESDALESLENLLSSLRKRSSGRFFRGTFAVGESGQLVVEKYDVCEESEGIVRSEMADPVKYHPYRESVRDTAINLIRSGQQAQPMEITVSLPSPQQE